MNLSPEKSKTKVLFYLIFIISLISCGTDQPDKIDSVEISQSDKEQKERPADEKTQNEPGNVGKNETEPNDSKQNNSDKESELIDPKPNFATKNGYFVRNGEIIKAFEGKEKVIKLHGINWFGLETKALALHGLWQDQSSIDGYLKIIKDTGLNALRVPLAPETLDPNLKSQEPWASKWNSGREMLEELLVKTQKQGLYVLLDMHTCHYKAGYKTGRIDHPECPNYNETKWLKDLEELAALALKFDHIVGIDIYNEPHYYNWKEWKKMAERAAKTIIAVSDQSNGFDKNPSLIFVEGVGSKGYTGSYTPFWGENFKEAENDLPQIDSEKLIFSPHVYGPDVFMQDYFSAQSFPLNMPAIWDSHFGYLKAKNKVLAIGEFGGKYKKGSTDKEWQDSFTDYLISKNIAHWFYWSLNPNSGDTGGLLEGDWKTINSDKEKLLRKLISSKPAAPSRP